MADSYHYIKKRDGKIVAFDVSEISTAIFKAAQAVGGEDKELSKELAARVADSIFQKFDRKIPNIEDVQDAIEKVLIDSGHAKTAKAFILYRENRARARKRLVVRKQVKGKADSTDLSLLVAPASADEMREWDRSKIVEALEKEAALSRDLAEKIAANVEDKIIDSGVKVISTALVRELVDNELFEMGLNVKLEKQTVIGMPVFDLKQLIFSKTNENSNVAANNPEAVNLSIAENTLKQFALRYIFTKDIAEAHLKGAVHLHDLGYPIRVYCSAHSLDYIKKYGLRLLNLSTASAPARHAQTLTGHLNTFLASMQAYYAGALGISYINIAYAPLLVGMDYNRLKQEAQYLIYSCSQNAFSRGGQTLFIDFNVHLGVPAYIRDVPAIGPKGKYMLRHIEGSIEELDEVPRNKDGDVVQPESGRIMTYGDFEKEAQAFAKVMMDVWRDGDAEGKVFPFPKMDLHINNDAFRDPTQLKLLKYACQISSENGSPYFIFDRDECTLSACCRLRTKVTDSYVLKHPESLRFCGFQNVTINLPQAAYRAGKGCEVQDVIDEIFKTMEIVIKAHLQKKAFIQSIMDTPGMPLWQVGMKSPDGRPYIDLDQSTYIIGLVGLNECVRFITGRSLHEDDASYKMGLKIISAMYLRAKEYGKKHNLKFTLEESPAESASLRMAKIDLKEYPESKNFVRGDIEKGEVYYTNSIHLVADANVDIIERIEKQSKFNQLIESGAITHVFVGEKRPSAESIFQLVKKTWDNTQAAQITVSPEFTICNDCHRVSPGYMREDASQIVHEKR